MATQKKIDTVNAMTEKIKKAKSIVFADYVGIKHKQLEELRKAVKKENGEFMVTKNKLLERALGDNGKAAADYLKNSTATLFAYQDEVGPLKAMKKFFKSANLGKAKGGMLGSTFMTEADVNRLADLPAREVLIATVVGRLNSPIQGLHYALSWNLNKLVWALNAIKEKKG